MTCNDGWGFHSLARVKRMNPLRVRTHDVRKASDYLLVYSAVHICIWWRSRLRLKVMVWLELLSVVYITRRKQNGGKAKGGSNCPQCFPPSLPPPDPPMYLEVSTRLSTRAWHCPFSVWRWVPVSSNHLDLSFVWKSLVASCVCLAEVRMQSTC